MVFIFKSRRTKVDKPNLRAEQHSPKLSRSLCCGGRGGYVAIVCEGLIVVADKEDVLGLEIGMDEV